jgi:hypothetical protein
MEAIMVLPQGKGNQFRPDFSSAGREIKTKEPLFFYGRFP